MEEVCDNFNECSIHEIEPNNEEVEDEEAFVKIQGYDSYFISNYGTVASTKLGYAKYLMPATNSHGYLQVQLSKNGKTTNFSIHRLVAEHFIENPENKPVVDHIDKNKLNNKSFNLRWASVSENSQNRVINRNNTSGVAGVNFYKRTNKWRVSINFNNKRIHLGWFDSFEDAVTARKQAEIKFYQDFRPSFLEDQKANNQDDLSDI